MNCVSVLGLETREDRLLIRPSGSEPVIRITAGAGSAEQAHGLLTRAKELVETILHTDTPGSAWSPEGGQVRPEARYRARNQNPEVAWR